MPARQGGGQVPVPDPQATAALRIMQGFMQDLNGLTESFTRNLEQSTGTILRGNRALKTFSTDFRSIMHDSASVQSSMEHIARLQKTILKPGATKSQAVTTMQALIKEYNSLLKVMNQTHGGGRYVKEISKTMEGLRREMVKVERQNKDTWDAEGIRDANKALRDAHHNVRHLAESMKTVKVRGMRDEFRGLGDAIDQSFGGRLGHAIKRIPILAGALKGLEMHRGMKQAHANIQTHRSEAHKARHEAKQARADEVHAKHGKAGLRTLAAMGHHAETSTGKTGVHVPRGLPTTAAIKRLGLAQHQGKASSTGGALNTSGTSGTKTSGLVDLQGNPLVSGQKGRRGSRSTRLLSVAQAPGDASREDVREALGGTGGNWLGRTLTERGRAHIDSGGKEGGLIGKLGAKLMKNGAATAGEGAGEAVLSAGGGIGRILGRVGGSSVAMGSMAVVGALIAASDMVADSNKKIAESLGGGGALGGSGRGGVTANLSNVRNSLSSNSYGQHLMGMNFDSNIELYKTLQEGGVNSGHTLKNGINLGDALTTGEGFHGAMQRNAYVGGYMNGMDPQSAIRQTLKLIDKFGAVTEATQGFFADLNSFSDTSGISASRIVSMVDNIGEGFSDLQKSLLGTVQALENVGRAGLLTGERLEKTVAGMTKRTEMSTAQRFFNVDQTLKTPGAADRLIRFHQERQAAERDAFLNEGLKKRYNLNGSESAEAIRQKIMAAPEGEDRKMDMNAFLKWNETNGAHNTMIDAWSSGDRSRVTSAQETLGTGDLDNVQTRLTEWESQMVAAGITPADIKAWKQGDQNAKGRISQNLVFGQMLKGGVLGGNEGFDKDFTNRYTTAMTGAQNIESAALSMNGQSVNGLNPQDPAAMAKMRLLERYGKIEEIRAITDTTNPIIDKKTGQRQYGAADAITHYMNENKDNVEGMGKLTNALMGLDDLVAEQLGAGGDIHKVSETQTPEQKAADMKARREEAARVSTPTADVFAHSFEYLFERVVTGLAKIRDAIHWGGDSTEQRQAKGQEVKAGLERFLAALSPEERKRNPQAVEELQNLHDDRTGLLGMGETETIDRVKKLKEKLHPGASAISDSMSDLLSSPDNLNTYENGKSVGESLAARAELTFGGQYSETMQTALDKLQGLGKVKLSTLDDGGTRIDPGATGNNSLLDGMLYGDRGNKWNATRRIDDKTGAAYYTINNYNNTTATTTPALKTEASTPARTATSTSPNR